MEKMAAASSNIISTLGETAIYTSKIDGFKKISVIFDPAVLDIDPDAGGIDNTVPVATAKTEDVKNVRNKDTLEINDVKYEVKRIRPDGTGLTELIMSKV